MEKKNTTTDPLGNVDLSSPEGQKMIYQVALQTKQKNLQEIVYIQEALRSLDIEKDFDIMLLPNMVHNLMIYGPRWRKPLLDNIKRLLDSFHLFRVGTNHLAEVKKSKKVLRDLYRHDDDPDFPIVDYRDFLSQIYLWVAQWQGSQFTDGQIRELIRLRHTLIDIHKQALQGKYEAIKSCNQVIDANRNRPSEINV